MARLNFNSIFNSNTDGSIEPRQRIRVGGVTFEPGVRFNQGVVIAGVDFSQFRDRDFEVDVDGDVIVIKGVF